MGARRGHGEGSIYKRSDDRWVASVDFGYVDGRRRRKVVYGRTRKEVSEKLRRLQASQVGRAGQVPTVDQWVSEWVEARAATLAPKTLQDYRLHARHYIGPHLGRIRLDKLTPLTISRWTVSLMESGLSPRTAGYAFSTLRAALNQALKLEIIATNPASRVKAPKKRRARVEALTLEEARRVLAADGELRSMFVVALTTGARQGELRQLRWDDVDLEGGVLHIREAKTGAGWRDVALPRVAVEALGEPGHGLVWPRPDGKPWTGRSVLYRWHRTTESAIGRRTKFHISRHTAASLAIAAGTPLVVVSESLGHSDVSITSSTYTEIVEETKRAAAARMDELFR